jgi:hypothetical protein
MLEERIKEMKGLTAEERRWEPNQCHDSVPARCDCEQVFFQTSRAGLPLNRPVRAYARYPALVVTEQTWFACADEGLALHAGD